MFERVEAHRLGKDYGLTPVLRSVSFVVEAGNMLCIQGPNGSGKSTLLKLLALLESPTHGWLRFGTLSVSEQIRASIGVVGHQPMLYPELTGEENLLLFFRLYALENPAQRVAELSEWFAAQAFLRRPVAEYSRGQLQRVAIARALGHRPKLLIFDEPSTGLDDRGLTLLHDVLSQHRNDGGMVIMVSHGQGLLERLADQTLHLQGGKIIAVDGKPR